MANRFLIVRSALPDKRVALWDTDPRHPNGEVYVAGSHEVEVYPNARVLAKIRSGELTKIDAHPSKAEQVESPAVDTINGIGPKTAAKLNAAGVMTVADLVAADIPTLAEATGLTVDQLTGWQEAAQ